jgi:hypothetical protein
MEDKAVKPRHPGLTFFGADWLRRTYVGTVVAALVGVIGGALIGAFNQATLTGEEYEDLFVGFGEYSAYGMATIGVMVAAIYGGVAAAIAGAVTTLSRRRWAGMVCGTIASVAVVLFWPELFEDPRRQAGFLWFTGMLIGSVAAAAMPWFKLSSDI